LGARGGDVELGLLSTWVPGVQRLVEGKSCFAVHSFGAALRGQGRPRKVLAISVCRTADFTAGADEGRPACSCMSDRSANNPANVEPPTADIDGATRRLMAALDALESAVERRREADRDEDELATRIQALGADRSRLADELDVSLVKSRRLERANREIAERLDAAIGTIRDVLGGEEGS
jgi:hypothetical protein